jgi:DNA-directed RNA polymerase specialized sigma24 family protein
LVLAANSFQVESALADSPVQMFAEFAGNIRKLLTPNEQTLMADIFPLLVLGKGHQETARIVGCSTKTIQRLLKRIQTLELRKKSDTHVHSR